MTTCRKCNIETPVDVIHNYCPVCYEEILTENKIKADLRDLECEIPTRFKSIKHEDPPESYVSGNGAYIWGAVGTGKSVLSFQVARRVTEMGRGGTRRLTASSMMIEFKNFDDGRLEDKIYKLQHVPILIIDDLGSEKATEFTYECLYEVLNYRNEWEMFTIITSNKEFKDFDDRIASRILQMCVIVHLDGEDRRLTK